MKKRSAVIALTAAFAIVGFGGLGLWYYVHTQAGIEDAVKFAVNGKVSRPDSAAALVPAILGFDHPRTILFLFLNNTELRPGGGFIGSFGIVKTNKGSVESVQTAGTDVFDAGAPATFNVPPPVPIQQHLIAKWYMRDSNWSPDFAVSARRALQFYAAEGGADADKIETVIGITPEVLETLLKYTGPITAHGRTFTAESITDLLEYTVEIDYAKTGLSQAERKAVISDIAQELMHRAKRISPTQWNPMLTDLFAQVDQKHIMMYDVNPDVQKTVEALSWGGRMKQGIPDKFMFVDANLASLKTDRVIDRSADYSIYQDPSGEWRAHITMHYKHSGGFDWRTTRYNTYTRWYFPAGTRFISGTGSYTDPHTKKTAAWDVGQEGDDTVVGTFLVIEPGTTGTAELTVALAPQVVAAIKAGRYQVLVQKQPGVPEFHLTIHHDFGTSVKGFEWNGLITKDSQLTASL